MTTEKLRLFFDRFIHRADRYAVQVEREGKWSFLYRKNPLSSKLVVAHLRGLQTIAAYPGSDSTTKWLCVDIDNHDLDELRRVLARYEKKRLPFLLEDSGRKGFHVWTFFERPVENWRARAVGKDLAPGHEVFPKQDTTSQEKPGNCVKLPLGVHQATGRRCAFLEPQSLRPFVDQFAVLRSVPLVSADGLVVTLPARRARSPPADPRRDVLDCVRAALRRGVSSGRRNSTAFLLAVALAHRCSPDEVLRELEQWNEHNSPQLSQAELLAVVRSAASGRYRVSLARLERELNQ